MRHVDRIAALTEKQRECLRMVLQHRSSKEIAQELGIGIDAVDQRLKAAMRNLGVNSRAEAARMLAEYEGAFPVLPHPDSQTEIRAAQNSPHLFLSRLGLRTTQGKFTIWSCIIMLILTALGVWEPLDATLRSWRADIAVRPTSGDIVLVAIDDRTVAEVGAMPWPRRRMAELVRKLDEAGASRLLIEFFFDERTNPADDQALAIALQALGKRLLLPASPERGWLPLPEFSRKAELVHLTVLYNDFMIIEQIPPPRQVGGRVVPAASALLGGGATRSAGFWIDYSFDPESIPVVSALDVLRGASPVGKLRGKDIVVGAARSNEHISLLAPRHGQLPGAYFHILAAETHRSGPPQVARWYESFVWGLIIVGVSRLARRQWLSNAILLLAAVGIACVPYILEPYLTYVDIVPPISLLLVIVIGTSWISYFQWRRERRLGSV